MKTSLVFIFLTIFCSDARRLSNKEPDDIDDFLASLELNEDPVTVVNNAHLNQDPHGGHTHTVTEEEAITTLETVRDREDQMHLSEAHRMKCDEILRDHNKVGQHNTGIMETSYMTVAEDSTIYGDTNDDTRFGHGSASNAHPDHRHHCHATKDHSVRKLAMLGEMDMPPFFEKLAEFGIEGIKHDKLKDDEFVKVILSDPKTTRLTKYHRMRKSGYGLDTLKVDGMPREDGADPYNKWEGFPLRSWILTSKTWDKEVKPKLEQIAKEIETAKKEGESSGMHPAKLNCDNAFDSQTDVNFTMELGCVLKAIEAQEKFVPFNHKLEMAKFDFNVCIRRNLGTKFSCKSHGSLYLHDGKLVADSADEALLDWLVLSTSTNPLKTSEYLPHPGVKSPFKNYKYNMEVQGTINWDVTISKAGHCTPAMQPLLYIGIGADEDPDDENDDVDLDLGAIFYQWEAGSSGSSMKKVGEMYYGTFRQQPGQLGPNFQVRQCPMDVVGHGRGKQHKASRQRSANCGKDALAEYSGDNLDGSGEGDDEWMLFDLEKLAQAGVTHIALVVNIYKRFTFGDLDGAFLRAVVSGRGEKQWATAQTMQYVDLDEMKSAKNYKAAVVATFFIDSMAHMLLPHDALVASQNKELAENPTLQALKAELTGLARKFKQGQLSSSEKIQFNQKKKELQILGKHKFEIANSLHAVDCRSSRDTCSLPNIYQGTKEYFVRNVGPQGVGTNNDKVADAKMKGEEANAIVAHELDVHETVSDIDDFLASLEETIPHNDELGVSPQDNVIDRQAHDMPQAEFDQGLLFEFPGGPPGSDVLCLTRKRN